MRKKYSSCLRSLALAYECMSASMLCSRSQELVFSVLKLTDAFSPFSVASAIGSTTVNSEKLEKLIAEDSERKLKVD